MLLLFRPTTGAFVYGLVFRGTAFRRILAITIVLAFFMRASQLVLVTGLNRKLGIPDTWFAVGDSAVLSAMSEMVLLPILVLVAKVWCLSSQAHSHAQAHRMSAAQVCPPGVEGTLYSLMMSVLALGGIVSDIIGTSLTAALDVTSTNFSNLWLLILICDLWTLLPLLFLSLVPSQESLLERTASYQQEDSSDSPPTAATDAQVQQ